MDFHSHTILCFVFRGKSEFLMVKKKQGKMKGILSVPGGAVEEGEATEDAVVRVVKNYCGLTPKKLRKMGILDYYFLQTDGDSTCSVYVSYDHTGKHTPDTEECTTEWVSIKSIDIAKMKGTERRWFPYIFQQKPFHHAYWFNKNGKVVEEKVIV